MSKDNQFLAGLLFVVLGNTDHNHLLATAQYIVGIILLLTNVIRTGKS